MAIIRSKAATKARNLNISRITTTRSKEVRTKAIRISKVATTTKGLLLGISLTLAMAIETTTNSSSVIRVTKEAISRTVLSLVIITINQSKATVAIKVTRITRTVIKEATRIGTKTSLPRVSALEAKI